MWVPTTLDHPVLRHWLSVLAISCVSAVGVCVPFAFNGFVPRGQWRAGFSGFSGGVLFGVAFLHLLYDSQGLLAVTVPYPVANTCFLVGAAIVAIMDCGTGRPSAQSALATTTSPYMSSPSHSVVLLGGDAALKIAMKRRTYAIQAAVAWHSVIHGLSFRSLHQNALIMDSVAFGAHQFLQGGALGIVAVEAELSAASCRFLCAAYTVAFPLGVAAAFAGSPDPPPPKKLFPDCSSLNASLPQGGGPLGGGGVVEGMVSGLAAGALACVAGMDMLPLGRAHKGWWAVKVAKVVAALVGVGLMAAVATVD
jgi:hypothetical protein